MTFQMLWAPAVIRRDSVLSVKKANNSVKKANNKDHDGAAGAKQRLHLFSLPNGNTVK
jgi:hypothetical protein